MSVTVSRVNEARRFEVSLPISSPSIQFFYTPGTQTLKAVHSVTLATLRKNSERVNPLLWTDFKMHGPRDQCGPGTFVFRVTESCFIEIGWDFLKRRGLSQNLYLHKTVHALETKATVMFRSEYCQILPSVFKFMQGLNKDKCICALQYDWTVSRNQKVRSYPAAQNEEVTMQTTYSEHSTICKPCSGLLHRRSWIRNERGNFLFRMKKTYEIVGKDTLVVHRLSIQLSCGDFY